MFNVWVIVCLLSISEKIRNDMLFWNNKAKHPNVKSKAEKEQMKKRKKFGWNISVEMTDGGEICGHPNLRLICGRKINKVIRPFKFGISICACCCNMVACVVINFFSSNFFPHLNFVILLLFFINLHMRYLTDRPGWMITCDELARFSKTSQHGKTNQVTAHLM